MVVWPVPLSSEDECPRISPTMDDGRTDDGVVIVLGVISDVI